MDAPLTFTDAHCLKCRSRRLQSDVQAFCRQSPELAIGCQLIEFATDSGELYILGS